MPGDQKDLQNAEAGADPDLNFSYNELIEELKREHGYAERQPGDITAREMSEVSSLTERAWIEILNKKVRLGELEKVRVHTPDRVQPYYVYRRRIRPE